MNHHFIGTRRAVVALCLGLLVVALGALTASAATITVTPGSPQGWASTGNSGGGSSAITTTAPRSGLGSAELTGDRTRWIKAVDPLAPAKLGDLYAVTDFAFDWMVATGSTSNLPQPPDQTPGLRLHVYDPNATNKYSELIWEGAYNGPVAVTQGSWVSTDMIGGSQLLWRWVTGAGITLDGGGAQVNQTVSAWQNSAWYSSDAVVFGVSVGVGSSVGAGYHAFTDNVVLGFSNAPDTFNFEPNPVCTTVCYADAVGGNDANDGITPATAKKTIQAAIDAVSAGGQVRVLPGNYSETATNRTVTVVSPPNGPHQFGLFFEETAKDGVTLMGVTAADVAITDPSLTEAVINTNATNNFGPSGIFVEADNVTIAGLEIGPNTGSENKTIEVLGDAFKFKNSFLNVPYGGALYFGDWRFDTGTNTSYILTYEVDNNIFSDGSSVNLTSGAGYSGATADKKITNNQFESSLATYTANGNMSLTTISFTGDTTTVPWFVHPMTGAVITGNTFNNTAPDGIHIRARGIADDSTFDWESYWNDNTFNKAIIVGPTLFSDVRAYSYACSIYSCNDVRQIGAVIQPEVNHAVNGDTVMVAPGLYPENVNVNKSVTLNGANAGVSPNDPITPLTANAARGPESELAVTGGGIAFRIQAPNVTIDGFKFTDSAVGQPDIQAPLIGAGWNYGGDAPGFKVVNNLFSETSRVLVYSNGSQMAGGTIDDNRVQDPGRADTGCGTTPTLPATNCGYQLFNPWRVDGLSFQGNVTVAAPGSNDRIRTLNIFNSTDVTVADNTIRNTCIFACFNIGSGTSGDVEVTGNDIETDVGNVIQFHSSWTTTGATINVHHNYMTTGADFPIAVDDLDADLDNVHINRNSITGGKHVRNGKDDLTIPGTETLDTTCNWWQSAAGPTPANFFGPVSYTPWLYTDDLDGPCFIGGTITVAKVAAGGGNTLFGFDPSWSTTNFTLADGGSQTSPKLQAGSYSVAEVTPLPTGWSLQSATCDNATTTGTVEAVSPSAITVADNDAWVCTFTNVYTPPPTNVCNVEDSSALWTDIIGKGMGNPKKHKNQVKLNIPNYAQVDSLYGQMVAKNTGAASYVRFILPGKNNYVQVNAVTSPADHAYGNFWYGEYIDPAKLPTKSVAGRWFLQKSGTKNHIPRALVLYPTYASPTNTYVNVWNTYDAAEGEAYWDTAAGWTATRVITESIAPPNGPTTFNVELAVVDNDKDARPIWVTVEAGGVTQTQMPNNPSDADQLNLMTFTLANVPAGTDEITITVYSPSLALDGVVGDSAALVGMRANYMCAPLN